MSQAQPNQGTGEMFGSGRPDQDAARPDPDAPATHSAAQPDPNHAHAPQPAAPPAFDLPAVVQAHESRLLRYVGSILGRGDGAQDVVQEVFLRLHRHVLFNGRESIEHMPAWLCKAAHNLAIDSLRRKKLDHETVRTVLAENAEERADSESGTLATMEKKEACDHALAALESLPPDLRGLVILKIDQGLTMRQIAEVTGLTPGNVGYRISQALSTMATRLKQQGVI